MSKPSEYVSLTEAAAILGVAKQTVAERVRRHGIPTYTNGSDLRQTLVRRADIEKWQGIRPVLSDAALERELSRGLVR